MRDRNGGYVIARACARPMSLPSTRLRGTPAHQVVDAVVLVVDEAEPAVEAHGGTALLDVGRDRLAGGSRLVRQVAQQRVAEPVAAVLGQEGDVEDAVVAPAALDIEPAGIL